MFWKWIRLAVNAWSLPCRGLWQKVTWLISGKCAGLHILDLGILHPLKNARLLSSQRSALSLVAAEIRRWKGWLLSCAH